MKKSTVVILIALVTIFGVAIITRLYSPEDTWVCKDGQWVKHGVPTASAPDEVCNK